MLATLITALLSYMDRPWKVLGVILLLIIGLLAFMVYDQRADISRLLLHHRPHLDTVVFDREAITALHSTDADAVQLFQVSLEDNLAVPVAGYGRGGGSWLPNPSARPLVYEHSDPRVVISVIAGRPLCGDIPMGTPLLRVEYDLGMRRICLIGVPPRSGVTIGLIYLAWKTSPPPQTEYLAKISLETLSKAVTAY